MKWATRAMIHFDRVASAWLILRFVDKNAQITFFNDAETAEPDAIMFGVPGSHLAAHDGEETTFQRILSAYSVNDPAAALLGNLVTQVVNHVLQDRDRSVLHQRDPCVAGVLLLAEGLMLLSASDKECLARSLPFYDALYARLQAQFAIDSVAPSPPASIIDQTLQLSAAISALRKAGVCFSAEAFSRALRT